MPIKKRPARPIKRRVKTPPPRPRSTIENLALMGKLLKEGHGTEEHARIYMTGMGQIQFGRLQSIARLAQERRSWDHLVGSYAQAMSLYVFAGIMYDQFPEYPPIMTDGAFDKLARWLLKHWGNLPDQFKSWYNITSMGLEAGSALGTIADLEMRYIVLAATGTFIEETQHERPAVLRRKKPIRGKPKPSGTAGRTTKSPVRRVARVKRPSSS
jgi:hypothetical protein